MHVWQVLSVVLVTTTNGASSIYEALRGHQVWRLSGDNGGLVGQLQVRGLVDVLGHSGQTQELRVTPEFASEVRANLHDAGIHYQVTIEDLAAHLQEEEESIERRAKRETENSKCTAQSCPAPLHDNYMTFEQMEWYLKEMNRTFPSKISVTSIGRSVLGRDLWLAHLKATNSSGKSIWIEAGIHAREWISSAVALHIVQKLIDDTSVTADVYVVPMANPDGYVYTWTDDRLWRKNRRINENSSCAGVDLNRNWDNHFGMSASNIPCSEVYQGPSAFSEPETQALSDAMLKVKDTLMLVLLLHSYGQELLYPWGWTDKEIAPNAPQLIATGKVFSEAVKAATGIQYSVQNSGSDLYIASGATDDWAMATLGSKYVYTLELRDTGFRGFALPGDEIVPCSDEVWQGLAKVINHINLEDDAAQ